MPRFPRLAVAAVLLAMSGALTSCADSNTVVRFHGVDAASIDRATLDHWMRALAGSDFLRTIGAQGPAGLASEPADYQRCIDAAKLVAPRSFFNQLRTSRAQLNGKCHELHRSVEAQALSFLISSRWLIAEGAKLGIAITSASMRYALALSKAQSYPSASDLRRYLTERQWSLSDLLYQIKLKLLARRIPPARMQQVTLGEHVGEEPPSTAASIPNAHLIAKTSCAKGYVVPGCGEYRAGSAAPRSPDAILRELNGK